MKTMHNIAVQIVRLVEGGYPGWVECELVDAAGRLHILQDKVPIFTVADLDADTKYPTPGFVRCEIVERCQNEKGQELVRVSTLKPDGIESTAGLSEFTVLASVVSSSRD
jgi:hypothetical protein